MEENQPKVNLGCIATFLAFYSLATAFFGFYDDFGSWNAIRRFPRQFGKRAALGEGL